SASPKLSCIEIVRLGRRLIVADQAALFRASLKPHFESRSAFRPAQLAMLSHPRTALDVLSLSQWIQPCSNGE
ncbi:hypothetical protein, partial [Xanthomonas cucurbitae]|uniref:hypothetical protein n=1 Tax=Xanthomonas cucurbitae TaxID=56453 RepID=UPI001B80A20F